MEPELNARNLALFVVESVVLFGALGALCLAMMCM